MCARPPWDKTLGGLFVYEMELVTKSPFPGDPETHVVVALMCGIRKCRATTPCELHDQAVIRFQVDGHKLEPALLSKAAYSELTELHRDPRELFHMLAAFALLANQDVKPQALSDAAALIPQGGF